MKTIQEISVLEQIKALNEQKKALTAQLPKKEIPQFRIEKREFNSLCMDDLLTLSKTSKVTLRYLRDGLDIRTMLSEKQSDNFNKSQYEILLKSPSTVVKMMTDKQKKAFIDDGNKVTPTSYLNLIIKGSIMKNDRFRKLQKTK